MTRAATVRDGTGGDVLVEDEANPGLQQMAEPAKKRATYADVLAAPPHVVAEIIDGVLETHPRPSPRHSAAAVALGVELGPLSEGPRWSSRQPKASAKKRRARRTAKQG